MFPTHRRAFSEPRKTITTSCKASLPLTFGSRKKQRISSTLGSTKTVLGGLPKAVPSHLAVLISRSSVSSCPRNRFSSTGISPSDDPQMPGLIPLIRKVRPELPIVYRSHIEIRSDLVHIPGSPQEEVWAYLWSKIKLADLFISGCMNLMSCKRLMFFLGHPVSKFVPSDVPTSQLALLGAATDW